MTFRRRVSAVLFAVLVLMGPGPAVSEQPPRAPVFGAGISLVQLPVFVTDRQGHAARGLTVEDFEVEEDGRRAEVVSFRYVDTTSGEEQEEIRLSPAARRRFLILFDLSFTNLSGLTRAQRAAADFVRRRLTPSDLAAVATFDIHNGMRLIANFTEDRALLVHAVDTLGVPKLTQISDPLGLAADFAVTDLTRPQTGAEDTTPQALLNSVLAVFVRQMRSAEEQAYRNHIATLLSGFEDLARALRGVEGRKQVLYFSAGFDGRLLVGNWGAEQKAAAQSIAEGRLWEVDGLSRYGDSRLRDALSAVTRSLSAADAVVHAMDVTGLGEDRSLSQTVVSEDIQRDTTNRQSLGFFSAETGGRLFKNANDLAPALAEMLDMTSRYYVLGFQPQREKGPGAFHKIKVKVARKGAKLSHRAGYFERAGPAAQSALQRQFDLAQLVVTGAGRNDLAFSSLCLPFPERGERQTLALVLQVPRTSLGWNPAGALGLEVYGYAVAEDGTVHDHLAQFARLDLAHADPGGVARGVSFFGTLSVPPGRYTLRLMIREGDSGATGVQFLDVTVPPYGGRAPFVLPPLLVDDIDSWLALDLGAGKATGASGAPHFRVEARPFLPRTSFETRPGAVERLVVIAFEPEARGDPAADVEIRSSLTAPDGRAAPPGPLRVDRMLREPDGRRTYLFSYSPGDLAAGDYNLTIELREGGTVAEAHALLRVRPDPAAVSSR